MSESVLEDFSKVELLSVTSGWEGHDTAAPGGAKPFGSPLTAFSNLTPLLLWCSRSVWKLEFPCGQSPGG